MDGALTWLGFGWRRLIGNFGIGVVLIGPNWPQWGGLNSEQAFALMGPMTVFDRMPPVN